MVRYFKYSKGEESVVINPQYVAHIISENERCVVTMNDGRRFVIEGISVVKLSEELEMLANYGGI